MADHKSGVLGTANLGRPPAPLMERVPTGQEYQRTGSPGVPEFLVEFSDRRTDGTMIGHRQTTVPRPIPLGLPALAPAVTHDGRLLGYDLCARTPKGEKPALID